MISKSMIVVSVAVALLSLACGPQYAETGEQLELVDVIFT